ncbi:MAG TPA: BON domain-containing protein [Rhodocyclaceae bacterium]|nr:BON domain-containing protein [Rhodocyclaceae bacterium]
MKLKSCSTRIATWALLAASTAMLSGCFGAAVVGTGAGVLMASDRRPAETYVTDEAIEVRAADRIKDQFGDRVHVSVTSYDRSVLLVGEVPDAATRSAVEKVVSGVPNVKSISNELMIAGANSLSGESNDAYITTKVKARFVDANQFSANHVKVVTEAGVVYLLGIVTKREADEAVQIARTTAGVMKVVRVFEIISEERARQIDSSPATSNPPAPAKP